MVCLFMPDEYILRHFVACYTGRQKRRGGDLEDKQVKELRSGESVKWLDSIRSEPSDFWDGR